MNMWRDFYVFIGLIWCAWFLTDDGQPNPLLVLWVTAYMLIDLRVVLRRRDWLFVAHHFAVLALLSHFFFGCEAHVRLQTLEWTFLVEASNPFLYRWTQNRGRRSGRTFGIIFVIVRLLYMGWLAWWVETTIGDWYAHGCSVMYLCQWIWFAFNAHSLFFYTQRIV